MPLACTEEKSVADHERDGWISGKKKEEVNAFLDRLYKAKRKVEQRIKALEGEDDTVSLLSACTVYTYGLCVY